MFASVVSGMGPLVGRQLADMPGIEVTGTGFDGRSDIVLFEAGRGHRTQLWSLRTLDDLFVEVGRTLRSSGDRPDWIANRVWRPEPVEGSLSVWAAELGRPLARKMTYRVIARVLREQSFLRTELRDALTRVISADKPRWQVADPGQLEIWICEYLAGKFVAGLRLSDRTMRQHDGREIERRGALRPAVAAMMVGLAGEPAGTLLDPCCGSGTILSEALAVGWQHVEGRDIDGDAVTIARRNVPGSRVQEGDIRHLDLPGSSVDAVVANLPFGQQFKVGDSMSRWLSAALAELARVVRYNGRVVLLAPAIPSDSYPASLRLRRKDNLKLLGTRTTLWVFDRVTGPDDDS